MWKIIDTKRNKVLDDEFETEEKAIEIMNKLISISIVNHDYRVIKVGENNEIN